MRSTPVLDFLLSDVGVFVSTMLIVGCLNGAIGMIFGRGWRGFLWGFFFGPLGWLVAFRRAVEVEQVEREEVREGRELERHDRLLAEIRAARRDYLAER